MKDQYVIGIDLGGTKVEACLMDSKRQVLSRRRRKVEADKGVAAVKQNIKILVDEVTQGKSITAAGIGTPGTYIPGNRRIYGSPHTPLYETEGFLQHIEEVLGVPLSIENDANCLALAEYFAQCRGRYGYVMAVIVGTGMGFGLILGDKLYRGARGGAGELGHTSIDIDGRTCECGRKGCAEAYLSGPSLSRRFYDLSGKHADTPEIYRLYQQGDNAAAELFRESFRLMGEVFANAINAFDLEAIILGGGVSNIPLWYENVPVYMNRSQFGVPRGNIPLLKAQLGDSSGVLGAAFLALRQIGVLEF